MEMSPFIHSVITWAFNDWINGSCSAAILVGVGATAYTGYRTTPSYIRKEKRQTALKKLAAIQENYEKEKDLKSQQTRTQEAIDQERKRKFKAQQESKFAQPVAVAEKWKHSEQIMTFFIDHIMPYSRHLREIQYYDKIIVLLSLLDATNCPSITASTDTGARQDVLKKIFLFDHSLSVAQEMAGQEKALLKEESITDIAEIGRRIGTALIVALGHDIGKIPSLFSVQNGKRPDHAYVSYLGMNAVLSGTTDKATKNTILMAIRDHHGQPVPGNLAYRLQLADKKVRERELEGFLGKMKDITDKQKASESSATKETTQTAQSVTSAPPVDHPIPERQPVGATIDQPPPPADGLFWLDVDEFLAEIEPLINRVDAENRFTAFSMPDGVVYVMPNQASDIIDQLAKKHNRTNLKDKQQTQIALKEMLAQKGLVPGIENIDKSLAGIRVNTVTSTGKRRGLFLPIAASAFKTGLTELEARKKDAPILAEIKEVKPDRSKKKSAQGDGQ